MIQVSFSLLALVSGALADTGAPAQGVDFQTDAERALGELAARCAAESGRLWGRSLCGATLLVDPKTRAFVARDLAGGPVERGELDPAVPLANTAVEWRGRRWAMVLWPLPADKGERERLLLHESWHRLQPDLNLSSHDLPRDHLGTVNGRSSIRLEIRALSQAVSAPTEAAIRRAACDALAIRFARYRQFTEASAGEAALERNEGLAEYTGWVGAAPINRARLSASLAGREGGAEFGRNFAYATGPAYGLLLDRFRPKWREPLDAQVDLGTMLLPAVGQRCANEARYAGAAKRHGLDRIAGEEHAIAQRRQARDAAWRNRLIDGPKATFPMKDAHIVFNPNDVVALPPAGDVYPVAEISAPWGKLVVTDGLLLARDWSRVTVSGRAVKVERGQATGEGWSVSLAPGAQLSPVGDGNWAIRVIFTPDMRSSVQ